MFGMNTLVLQHRKQEKDWSGSYRLSSVNWNKIFCCFFAQIISDYHQIIPTLFEIIYWLFDIICCIICWLFVGLFEIVWGLFADYFSGYSILFTKYLLLIWDYLLNSEYLRLFEDYLQPKLQVIWEYLLEYLRLFQDYLQAIWDYLLEYLRLIEYYLQVIWDYLLIICQIICQIIGFYLSIILHWSDHHNQEPEIVIANFVGHQRSNEVLILALSAGQCNSSLRWALGAAGKAAASQTRTLPARSGLVNSGGQGVWLLVFHSFSAHSARKRHSRRERQRRRRCRRQGQFAFDRVVMQMLLLSQFQYVLKMIGVLTAFLHHNVGWNFLSLH